jgi:hypothetical protein
LYVECWVTFINLYKATDSSMIRRVAVSDTHMTLLRHVLDNSYRCPKKFISRHSLDRCPTPFKHSCNTCRISVPKDYFSFLLLFLDACPQRLKMSKQRYQSMKDWRLDKIFSFFFYSRWINKNKILLCFVNNFFKKIK